MRIKVLFALCLAVLIAAASYGAEEVARAASLTGRVDIFRAQSPDAAVPLKEDDAIFTGDSVRTKSGSKARLEFKDKTVLNIAQNSKITVKQYSFDHRSDRLSAAIELSRGKAMAVISRSGKDSPFVISTPNAECSVVGSEIIASYQSGNSLMFVNRGKASVVSTSYPGKPVSVSAGNGVMITQREPPNSPRPILASERRMYEEETRVPKSLSKTANAYVIKGIFTEISGDVRIANQPSGKLRKVKMGEVVQEGDRVETGVDGYAQIRLDNNNAINLKPDTKLSIIKLLFNSATSEFENIFEVTIGKIKARIEGLKGSSKFEVKTPTATCGARGTIAYVDVFTDRTVGFFEGGDGYIANPISGNVQDVAAGSSSTSYNTGSITAPSYVSVADRQGYNEGWGAGGSLSSASGGGSDAMDIPGMSPARISSELSTLENYVDSPVPASVFVSVPVTQTNPSLLPVTTQTTSKKDQPYPPRIGNYSDGY